ncbi:hypothetical protein [Amycolatopsis saalfeldensis]|uniref:hypothetical protein n=1 Tax=Amycolatopsis saalfeldensis TaxID=394193 RepID=UPI000A64804D|nr:hypothetical protein [Amycolatopsis saalfeldensis]
MRSTTCAAKNWRARLGALRTLAGVSTIAFTTDGKLVAVRQSARNSVSGLLLAPSGSGSLEPRDLRTADGGERRLLHTAVGAGMERELREESGVHADEITSPHRLRALDKARRQTGILRCHHAVGRQRHAGRPPSTRRGCTAQA